MSKAIVITGGTGYVGSRVAEALLARGFKVIAVDLTTPKDRGISFSPGIEFRQHDLRVPAEALQALEGADLVLHLAADMGSLTYMHDHQAEILTNNSSIDAAVYTALLAHNIKWVVYSSSSGVYQHAPRYPYVEEDIFNIRPPTNTYFLSKLVGEYFCRSYAAQYGLNYTIIRYHNIYGPGEDSKGSTPGDIHVIPALLQKVMDGQYPLEFLGHPEATRPFTYIDDAVDATVEIVVRAVQEDPVVRNEDFNIGNDKHYTVLELGKMIWRYFGDERPFKFKLVETKADTALRREVDITKIRERIGWMPKTSLEDTLPPVAQWIQERKTGKRSLW